MGRRKPVVQCSNDRALQDAPDLFFRTVGLDASVLTKVSQHKWLGVLWRADLDFEAALEHRIRSAAPSVASLSGWDSVKTKQNGLGIFPCCSYRNCAVL